MPTNEHFAGKPRFADDGPFGRVWLTEHRRGAQISLHQHTLGYASLCLEGSYDEGDAARIVRKVGVDDAILHSDRCVHDDLFGRTGGLVLSVEPSIGLRRLYPLADFSATRAGPDTRLSEMLASFVEFRSPVGLLGLCRMLDGKSSTLADDWAYVIADLENGTLPIGKIAAQHGWKPCDFSRRFHRRFMVTPSVFRLRFRLRQAIELVADTKCSWTAAAYAAGFADSAHLSRTCRRFLGTSPVRLGLVN